MVDDFLRELKEDIDKKFLDYRLAGTGIMTVVFTVSAGVIGSFAVTDKVSARLALCLFPFTLPMLASLYQQYLHYCASKLFADGLFHRLIFFMNFKNTKAPNVPVAFNFTPNAMEKSNQLFSDTEKWFLISINFFIASLLSGTIAISIEKKWPQFLYSLNIFCIILGTVLVYYFAYKASSRIFIHQSLKAPFVEIKYSDGSTENKPVG